MTELSGRRAPRNCPPGRTWHTVEAVPEDIYTEPPGDPDTLANLGPLRSMAGIWEGSRGPMSIRWPRGRSETPSLSTTRPNPSTARPTARSSSTGLRYHTHIVKPGEVETFHDQVGYWLWEPAAKTVTLTLGIPRGQVLLAGGPAEPDATEFEVTAAVGSEVYGILSNPFLDQAFRTLSYRMRVTAHPDGSWSYEEEGVLDIPDRPEPFHHVDRNTLVRLGEPTPNPLAGAASAGRGLGLGSLRDPSDRYSPSV